MALGRRELLAGAGALASASQLPRAARASHAELGVGFIYVGARDDLGYNQTHAEAAARIARLPGVRVIEQERVPESAAVEAVMEAMIVQDGAALLYPTSHGYYDPHLLKLARKYPEVVFRHAGGLWREGDPRNIGSYSAHMHEGQHLAGLIASHHAQATGKIGFVASFRYPGVLRNVNAFALGARLAHDTTVQVIFTSSWSDPVKEAEAVNLLADQGATVIACSVDSAKTVVETARRRGLRACGYNHSMAALGGEAYLASSVVDWSAINLATVATVQAHELPANYYSGGIAEGLVRCDVGAGVLDGELAEHFDAVRGAMEARRHFIWQGPIRDNQGVERIAAGVRVARTDPRLQKMDWFVEGVQS